ncbi:MULTISPECIES: baseplate J/gp47 family protein [unclassified Clostridium]|uniref:baseplate J/gp47 family protein n=1 Tax=unclassified Clostridium TaxID=2614128 RepID=UPI00029744B1|nr:MULTISPECIES: baseplate J/gp47 family protein [unclassified Clostridium]EKQ51389.1 MAG: putative phage Mu protein gp47-like protein [Clostridium sp. Maddingley MBC34-26]
MSDSRDVIQARLLSNISDEYNKSEGEVMYDAEKPVAIELESAYVRIDGMLDKRFADKANGKDLERVVKNEGIYRKLTTKSYSTVTITGIEGAPIVKGEKVASDNVNFVFTEDAVIPQSKTIEIKVECEKYGSIGNVPAGAIKYFPKTLAGLQTVTNKEAISNGYNEESDDELRKRYYAKIQTPSTSGNKYHYRNWALEVTGVGNARVLPLWNGNGTVKIVIINSNKTGADQALVNSVKNYIDPVDGEGEGQAPIGATVTVVSAVEKSINVTANVSIVNGLNLGTIQEAFKTSLIEYLQSVSFDTSYISIAKVGDILFNTDGVLDHSDLKINNLAANVNLLDTEIAVVGTVQLGVM